MDGHEEIEADIEEEDVRTEVEVKVRVVMSEEKRFTLALRRPSNDKMKILADDLGELLNLSRYALTFFYKGDKVALNERIGDREIGSLPKKGGASVEKEDSYLLCLKGGSEGPKTWKRFTHVDDPCRQLSYISDDEAFDAISFIPKKDI
jgi:hypothetical protein